MDALGSISPDVASILKPVSGSTVKLPPAVVIVGICAAVSAIQKLVAAYEKLASSIGLIVTFTVSVPTHPPAVVYVIS